MELEVEEFDYSYRDEQGNIIAEFDDLDAQATVLRTLIADGHGTLHKWVGQRRALGSYGDFG